MGATVDIFALLSGIPILITATIVNFSAEGIGVATLAIGDAGHKLMGQAIEGASIDGEGMPAAIQPRRVLALGAGGGKIVGQLKMIEILERVIGAPVTSFFDLFAGCSSGALVLALLSAGYSLAEAREVMTSSIQRLGFANFFLNNLMDKAEFHRRIDESFGTRLLDALSPPLFTLSRNFNSSIHRHYSAWSEGKHRIAAILKRATAIPVLLGAHENEMDGGAGLFINPVELLLRVMRHKGLLQPGLKVVYIDAGFDPLVRSSRLPAIGDNILTQLLWVIGAMQRDLNVLATDRIASEFPGVDYCPYFFTFSKAYDLSRRDDFFLAEEEVENRSGQFEQWCRANGI